MPNEYAELQKEYQLPDAAAQDVSDRRYDIADSMPLSGIELTEIPEDTEPYRAEMEEVPDIPEDTEPYRVEMTDAPEIPEDVPGSKYPEYPWMNDASLVDTPHFKVDSDGWYYLEIPEDTISAKEIAAELFPEIPEDTAPEADFPSFPRRGPEGPSPVRDTEEIPEDVFSSDDASDKSGPGSVEISAGKNPAISEKTTVREYHIDNKDTPGRVNDAATERYAKIGDWPKAKDAIPVSEALVEANPHYEDGEEWTVNCQRCVPTYEMRRRGFDVTAQPCLEDMDELSLSPFDVWEDPDIISCQDDDRLTIMDEMSQWEDGARAQIVVMWANGMSGHTFIAEKIDGEVRFIDPQTGDTDCSYYFDEIEPGTTQFCRIDNLRPSEKILKCCS